MKKLFLFILGVLAFGACRPDDPKPEPTKQKQSPPKPDEGQYPVNPNTPKQ